MCHVAKAAGVSHYEYIYTKTKMQFSCMYSFVTLAEKQAILVLYLPATLGMPHSKFAEFAVAIHKV